LCAGGVDVHVGDCPPQLRLLAHGSSFPAGSRPPFPGVAWWRSLPLLSRRKQR
jgi:hypothetical protein